MAKGTPSLPQVIQQGIEQALANVHTTMPGKVVAYNTAESTVDVQPHFKRKYVGFDAQTLPVIPRVPIAWPRFGNAWIRIPIKVGDYVQLQFAERSLDRWMSRGEPTDPEFPAKHALADAIAVPGLHPATAPLTAKGADTSLEIANGTGYIEITSAGRFKFENAAAELLTELINLLAQMTAAANIQVVPATGTGTFSVAVLAQLAIIKTKLEALKA